MEPKENKENEKVTRVGYAAKDAKMTELQDGRKVANLTILTGTKENLMATFARGWNAVAEKIGNIKKGEKWELKGSIAEESGTDGKMYKILTIKEAYPHVKMHIDKAEIRHMENKKIGSTPMRNIMIVQSEIRDGKPVSNVYNIELYGPAQIKKSEGFSVGQIISISGHARHYPYLSKTKEEKVNIAFQNPREIKNLSLMAKNQYEKKQKEEAKSKNITSIKLEGSANSKSKKKSKSKGIDL
jgi:hypothetical protein